MHGAARHLNQTPERPDTPITPPAAAVTGTVEIDGAQLRQPGGRRVPALARSEAEAFARVDGDDRRLNIEVAVPDLDPCTVDHAVRWIRWVVHNAGVRGTMTVVAPPAPGSRSRRWIAGAEQVVDDDVTGRARRGRVAGEELGLSERRARCWPSWPTG